jgi:serine/threonine protein kinase
MAAAKRLKLDVPSIDELVLPSFVRRGDPFDEYVDIEEVGLGAFGFVYQAKSRSGGNPKAIKVVNAGHRETKKIQKALNECQIGILMNHPNILPIQHVWYDGTRFFFVMDLVEPVTASNLPKSLKGKLMLFQQLVSAVAHLYSKGILHRDIKFQNTGIMLGEDGEPQLVLFDFGEACEKSDHYTECPGTVLNMSPEVVNFSHFSDRSEVWALMCYLVELLTGKPMILHLFDGPLGSIASIHVQLKIDSLKEPPIPEVLKTDKSRSGILLLEILRRGLAINPADRLTFPELEHLLLDL